LEASLPAGKKDIFTSASGGTLGLTLEPRKKQGEVLVIDHIDLDSGRELKTEIVSHGR
jgi:hypothetical protein